MRLALVSVAALLATVAACAPSSDEESDGAGEALTGGSTTVESPIVFLFDGADTKLAPKCSGALISDTMAVTAKACAKVGLTVGRAADDDGKGKRTTVKALHVPDAADAEIVVVELAASIGGQPAVITHAPLRDDYKINSWSSKDQTGLLNSITFKADKGEASSIGGRLVSETATAATIVPDKGTTICATDIGAPVCSSTSTKLLGWEVRGTCGLSGLVVAAPEGTSSLTNTANGGCSDGAWKVATLGQHADFLKKLAPKAFQPIAVSGIHVLPAYVADGLWGYKSGGNVKTCKITTTNLTSIQTNGVAKVAASVSFAAMQDRAAPYGRFGIAPKATPEKMTWFAAKTTKTGTGAAFDATFEGTVGAAADGEYVVAFRASGSGGESWTLCDTSGPTTKLTADKALSLLVGNGTAAAATLPAAGATTVASGTTTSAEYSDPAPNLPSTEESDPAAVPVAKKEAAAGCSAAPGIGGSSPLSIAGILLGLAAVVRRRKK